MPRKFLCPAYYASYDNPYGRRVLSKCFWPVTFKKGGMKFWIRFLEKYGMPFMVGRHPRGAQHAEVGSLLDMLEKMVQDAVAAIPDDSSVEILSDAVSSASSDIYDKLASRMDAAIAKVYLGHSAAADATPGKLGEESNSLEATRDLTDTDVKIVEKTFSRLIRWINEINFSQPDAPRFCMWEEEYVDKTLAERDEALSRIFTAQGGLRFSKKYLQKTYGFQDEDIIEPPNPE